MMPRLTSRLASSALAAAICAAGADAAAPTMPAPAVASVRAIDLTLTDFDIAPEIVHLRAGQRVLLRIINDSPLAHDLTAPEFFAASIARPAEGDHAALGRIALRARESVTISVAPRAGRYPMKCSHPLHRMLGMSGTIVVDP